MADKREFLNEFKKLYDVFTETDQKNFSRIVSRFLHETFIIKDCEDDRKDYFFVIEHDEAFKFYFSLIDYDFIIDRFNSLVYIVTLENRNRVHLTKFDTAIVLILRKLFYIKRKEITSAEKIIVTVDDLCQEIRTSQIYSNEPKIASYDAALKKLRIHKIVSFVGAKLTADSAIQILPSIQMVIPQEDLENITVRLEALRLDNDSQGGDNDEDSDED